MQTKIIIVQFDLERKTIYKQMMDVLIFSIQKNMPNAEIISVPLTTPELNGIPLGFVANTIKLSYWMEELSKCQYGDNVIFMDCDMLVLSDLSSIFEKDFDVAYTLREQSKFPINGGVIFIKFNERSDIWLKTFQKINNEMFDNPEFHLEWKLKYAGMNQAAMGYMVETHKNNIAKSISVPCKEWNCCNESWGKFGKTAKILHVKGKFRRAVLGSESIDEDIIEVVNIWKKYEQEYLKSIK